MTATIGATEVDRFRVVVAERLGLWFDDWKLGYLAEVLERRTDSSRLSVASYLEQLENQRSLPAELRALAQELTVAETYFLRHLEQLHACVEIAVPDRLSTGVGARKLSILSAGCASGEEAYSLAMLMNDKLHQYGVDIGIRAVDINPVGLAKARMGRYSAWALRETPADIRRRWFQPEGREFLLDPAIRALVTFDERNLVSDDPDLWSLNTYDIVFCRNVMMYFTPDQARALVARITHALAPGGYLFLGHAETLRGLSQDYSLRHTHQTFYYQRTATLECAADKLAYPLRSFAAATHQPADLSWTTHWLDTVQRSSARIQTLAETPQVVAIGTSQPKAPLRRPELGVVIDLLKQERFTEALESIRAPSEEFPRDPDMLLLRAALLTHSGQLQRAAQVCHEFLSIDELNAGAHYLLALCCEGVGDRQGAIDHHQAAVYLDPSFAMPRLQLGLLARRTDDQETARRELGRALRLLGTEEASRLLLFGGGFSRDALMQLCRRELLDAGGKP